MIEEDVEVFRSRLQRSCDDRAFMLRAVGIASAIVMREEVYRLQVPAEQAARARAHLEQYELENRPANPYPPLPPARLHPHAWVGCVVYAAWLIAVPFAITHGLVALDAFHLGELYSARVRTGQWWRAWTALTLHMSAAHLAGNLGVGLWFGYLAGRQLGGGVAWLLIVLGGGFANLVEALTGPAGYRSVGASTAVFTALGLMAAYTWRERLKLPQGWVQRWAPLGAGLALLGWFGTSGKHTDLMAHLLGFVIGVLLGWMAALPPIRERLHRLPQWPAGLAALAVMVLAWSLALAS